MKDFLKTLMSIDESKNSIIVWAFIITLGVGLWKAFKYGDFPDNLLTLTEFFVGAILGGFAVSKFTNNNNNPNI